MSPAEAQDPFDPERFLQDDFSAQAYTQNLLDQLASGDADREESAMSLALSRLSVMMEELNTAIREEVTEHYALLIDEADKTTRTEQELMQLVDMIVSLQSSVQEMRANVREDYLLLKTLDQRIPKLQLAADTLRRTISFLLLCRRLEIQLSAAFPPSDKGSASLPAAASTVETISTFLGEEESAAVPITKLDLIAQRLPWIQDARTRLTSRMEDLVVTGLKDLSPSVLNDSLQTALNLGLLPSLVSDLLGDLTDVIRTRVKTALDPAHLQREFGANRWGKKYTAYGRREEDAEKVWKRLEVLLLHDMVTVCKKVSILEKVLRFKHKGPRTLLDDVLETLGDRPSLIFWKTMADAFTANTDLAMAEVPPLRKELEDNFLRLVQIFIEFFDRVALYADTTYTYVRQSPEASMIMLRLKPLSQAYLARVRQRLLQAEEVGAKDGRHFAQLALKELDITPPDAFLLRGLVDLIPQIFLQFGEDISRYASTDPLQNGRDADLAAALLGLIDTLKENRGTSSYPLRAVVESSLPPLETVLDQSFLTPLLQGLMERVQLPISHMSYTPPTLTSNSISPYMEDLREKVDQIPPLLKRYQLGIRAEEVSTLLVNHLVAAFVEQVRFVCVPTSDYVGSARLRADWDEVAHLAASLSRGQLEQCTAYPDLIKVKQELQL